MHNEDSHALRNLQSTSRICIVNLVIYKTLLSMSSCFAVNVFAELAGLVYLLLAAFDLLNKVHVGVKRKLCHKKYFETQLLF
jgi:hypothetical protein